MRLQRQFKEFFQENGMRMDFFAKKIGLNKQQLYQVVSGNNNLPKKCWFKVIELTRGKISLLDILQYNYRNTKELKFEDIGELLSCKVSLK